MTHHDTIVANVKRDRDLDKRVATNVSKELHAALRQVANDEHDGNMAGLVRSCLVSFARQRYLLTS